MSALGWVVPLAGPLLWLDVGERPAGRVAAVRDVVGFISMSTSSSSPGSRFWRRRRWPGRGVRRR